MRNPLILLVLAAGLVMGDTLSVLAQTNTTNSTNATNPFGARGRRGGSLTPNARMNGDQFEFRGGSLAAFMSGVFQVFGYELQSGVDSSVRTTDIRIPSMKLRTQKVADVLDLYNQIGESNPSMGRWVLVYSPVEPEKAEIVPTRPERPPNSVLFVPWKEQKAADQELEVKAITLRGMAEEDRKRLYGAIEQTVEVLDQDPGQGEHAMLLYNKQTDILVVKGRRVLVDAVVRMVDAFREGLTRDAAMARKPEETKNDK